MREKRLSKNGASKKNSASKFQMKMSLNVLNHLGFNLYSNIPAVLSEVVANAYDADATEVTIDIKAKSIVIQDNGNGMTVDDINNKFLLVGYQKRENNEAISPVLKRPVMGRKGIGKLSLFSIANTIKVFTAKKVKSGTEKSAFELDRFAIEREIKASQEYYPKELPFTSALKKGTRIEISDFKKEFGHSENYLKRRLARRFSVIGESHKFKIKINNKPITIKDRDYFKTIQMLWTIGDEDPKQYTSNFTFEKVGKLNGKIDSTSYQISGWIGAVKSAGDLEEDGINNNKISIMCRGKMAQEDILESYNEGGIYAVYLIGEIKADFLDDSDKEDIATSSRQSIKEDDPRFQALIEHVYSLLKEIQSMWTGLRKELGKKTALSNAEKINPALKQWFESLKTTNEKEHAIELFSTIDNLHFVPSEEKEKKRELYKYGILAFEKLKLKKSLGDLGKIKSADDVRLAAIFADLTDIEASMYYDMAAERVEVIKKFQSQLDANDKEKLLRNYLFDNLWLLNPSWERASKGTEIMEQRVNKAFGRVTQNLSAEEKSGRVDIKYRTYAGKHIILELKRYRPSYKISTAKLMEQVVKYRDALHKCLVTAGASNEPIESIIILGEPIKNQSEKEIADVLRAVGARVVYYDHLIEESLQAYSDYIKVHAQAGKIKAIIDHL